MFGIHNQMTDILLRQNLDRSHVLLRQERMFLNDYDKHRIGRDIDRIGKDTIRDLRQINTEVRRSRPLTDFPSLRFRNELHRLRYFYGIYVDSLDNVRLNKSVKLAIGKLLKTLKRSCGSFEFTIQIFRELKRSRQKIKLLYLPIKIIPDSLRPIKPVA